MSQRRNRRIASSEKYGLADEGELGFMKSVEAQFEKIVVAKAKGAGEQTANLAIDAFHLSAGRTGVVKSAFPWRGGGGFLPWPGVGGFRWRWLLRPIRAGRPRLYADRLLPKFAQFLFEQVGALERLIDFQACSTLGGVLFQVVPAMQQQPSQALNGFLGRSVLRFPGQFTPQIIETFVHQLHDMKAVESQNRVWRVGSHAAAICSAHVHGHRFEPSSAELEAAPELTQSLCPRPSPTQMNERSPCP